MIIWLNTLVCPPPPFLTMPTLESAWYCKKSFRLVLMIRGKQSRFHQILGVIQSLSGVDCCDWSLSNMVTSWYGVNLPFPITQLIQDAIVEGKRFEFVFEIPVKKIDQRFRLTVGLQILWLKIRRCLGQAFFLSSWRTKSKPAIFAICHFRSSQIAAAEQKSSCQRNIV